MYMLIKCTFLFILEICMTKQRHMAKAIRRSRTMGESLLSSSHSSWEACMHQLRLVGMHIRYVYP